MVPLELKRNKKIITKELDSFKIRFEYFVNVWQKQKDKGSFNSKLIISEILNDMKNTSCQQCEDELEIFSWKFLDSSSMKIIHDTNNDNKVSKTIELEKSRYEVNKLIQDKVTELETQLRQSDSSTRATMNSTSEQEDYKSHISQRLQTREKLKTKQLESMTTKLN